jgi:NAD(P)-binding Rossmann-like domain
VDFEFHLNDHTMNISLRTVNVRSHRSPGIAGMAAAYALSQSGHRVRVLEKYPGLGQVRTLLPYLSFRLSFVPFCTAPTIRRYPSFY